MVLSYQLISRVYFLYWHIIHHFECANMYMQSHAHLSLSHIRICVYISLHNIDFIFFRRYLNAPCHTDVCIRWYIYYISCCIYTHTWLENAKRIKLRRERRKKLRKIFFCVFKREIFHFFFFFMLCMLLLTCFIWQLHSLHTYVYIFILRHEQIFCDYKSCAFNSIVSIFLSSVFI